MSFTGELKRRKVFRVAAAYLIASWVIIQAADILLENYGAPAWIFQALGVVLLLGFPLACVLAWAFDVVPDGGDSTAVAAGAERWIIPVLALLVLVLLGERIWSEADSTAAGVQVEGEAAQPGALSERSIAVLPFENFSSSEEHAFFSDGLADTILHRLAQIDDLVVIARNSSFTYKGQNVDVRKVGEELNVGTVLEGSVQRQGQNLRVIAQLVETKTGSHLWSKTFDRKMDDIFAIQDEIALSVAESLSVEMLGETIETLRDAGTDNPRALEIVMQVEEMREARSRESTDREPMDELVPLVKQAIRLDPDYVDAWVLLTEIHSTRAFRSSTSEEYEDALEAMRLSLNRALALDPASPNVRLVHAEYLRRTDRLAESLSVSLSALEDLPNDTDALSTVALAYLANHRDEMALPLLERARRIDPLSPYLIRQHAGALAGTGNLDEAERLLLVGIDQHPDFRMFYFQLSNIIRARGDWYGSMEVLAQAPPREEPGPGRTSCTITILFDRPDLFDALDCQSRRDAENLARHRLLLEGRSVEANAMMQQAAEEAELEEWRSHRTMYCILAEDKACALKHARAGFAEFLDEFDGANYRNQDTARALAYHALAEWKWGENKERARTIFRKVLEIVEAAEMVSWLGCTVCGQVFTKAELLAVLGRTDDALDALEASLPEDPGRVHLTGLVSQLPIAASPYLESIRDEPRFIAVMEEVERRRQRIGSRLEDYL